MPLHFATRVTKPEHFARWFGGQDVQVPADRLDYEPAAGRAWSATMVLPDGNTIDWAKINPLRAAWIEKFNKEMAK